MKTENSFKSFVIELKPYLFKLLISFEQTDKEVLRFLKKNKVEVHDDDPWKLTEPEGAITILFNSWHILIRMPVTPKDAIDFGMLYHEVFHAVSFALRRVGMQLSIESEESYAYLVQYVITEIYNKLNEKTEYLNKRSNNQTNISAT